MIYDEEFQESPITVKEEIEKRIRDGQHFKEALLSTVTQRLGGAVRRAGTDLRPVTETACEVARAAFRASLGNGTATVVAAQLIPLGLVRATSDLGGEASDPVAETCRTLFEVALDSHLDPVSIAKELLLGVIKGAREIYRDPSAFAGPAAGALLEAAKKHPGHGVRKLRILLLEGIDGVKIKCETRGSHSKGGALHHHARRKS